MDCPLRWPRGQSEVIVGAKRVGETASARVIPAVFVVGTDFRK
jgi:hypothetical protein